jgi:hypothetical protein
VLEQISSIKTLSHLLSEKILYLLSNPSLIDGLQFFFFNKKSEKEKENDCHICNVIVLLHVLFKQMFGQSRQVEFRFQTGKLQITDFDKDYAYAATKREWKNIFAQYKCTTCAQYKTH